MLRGCNLEMTHLARGGTNGHRTAEKKWKLRDGHKPDQKIPPPLVRKGMRSICAAPQGSSPRPTWKLLLRASPVRAHLPLRAAAGTARGSRRRTGRPSRERKKPPPGMANTLPRGPRAGLAQHTSSRQSNIISGQGENPQPKIATVPSCRWV